VRRLPRLPRLPQRLRLPLRRGLWRLRRLQLLYFVGILPRLLDAAPFRLRRVEHGAAGGVIMPARVAPLINGPHS
jgi:hypothetical protein